MNSGVFINTEIIPEELAKTMLEVIERRAAGKTSQENTNKTTEK